MIDFDLARSVVLQQPPRIVFGDGCAAQCGDELVRHGLKRPIIVTTKRAAIQCEPLIKEFKSRGLAIRLVTDVPAEPPLAEFERILARERMESVDAVIGLGGGSVLDVAKLLAALLTEDGNVRDFFGVGLLPGRSLYLACIPTTSGSGSEVSPNAVLLDETEQLKKGIVSPWLVPDAAFIDPLLTVSLPPAVTAAVGLDAMVHCIEAYANRHAHPIVDLYALQGVRLISAHLLAAVQNGQNLGARRAVALGSLYGGLCLGPVNTAAVHALAYPLGGEFHLAHGLSNALLLPHVLRFNLPATPRRYAEIAAAAGVSSGADDLTTATRGIAFFERLAMDCGLPAHLSACGIPASAIPRMAAAAMKVTRLLKNNPRELAASDAEAIYHAAL
jgi:alcohol dehydrogenase